MRERQRHIENTRQYVGWAYPELRWFTGQQASAANEARDCMLQALPPDNARRSCRGSKIYTGTLSRGCVTCCEGTWSCLMLNSRCTANCFFCPQEPTVKEDKPPTAGGIAFEDPCEYVDYLERFGIKGVGISGGEPLLVLDRLLSFIRRIKDRFGGEIYVWLYTNGDLLDAAKLTRLKEAGLDEIRLDIVHKKYDVRRVELARRHMDIVTVEIPAIPEDYDGVHECIRELRRIGVSHLNLHQLHATAYNYKNLIKRDYTFLHYPSNYPVPVYESEMTALRHLKDALDDRVKLPLNYCSHIYKYRYQNSGARRRAAVLARQGYEGITEAGYIRMLSLKSSSRNLRTVARTLKDRGCPADQYAFNDSKSELTIHHSLLELVGDSHCDLVLRYFDVRVNTQGQHRVRLESGRDLFVERQLVAVKQLAPGERGELVGLLRDDLGGEGAVETADDRRRLETLLGAYAAIERTEEGLAQVY
ncbi:MAG: radical SAM protein [Acidobacteriota bacterium]